MVAGQLGIGENVIIVNILDGRGGILGLVPTHLHHAGELHVKMPTVSLGVGQIVLQ